MPELEPPRPPERHCLLIDHGNSRVKWISAVRSAAANAWRLDLVTLGEGRAFDLAEALQSGELMPSEEILFCSVGAVQDREEIRGILARNTSAEVIELKSSASEQGINNGYAEHEKLGADRWMAVVAGAVHHGVPLVVMDLGTATTLDAVDAEGQHLGGLILPGPGTMLASLGRETTLSAEQAETVVSRLPGPGEAGTDTAAAILGGVLTAQLGALEQFAEWTRRRAGLPDSTSLKIVVTGGTAGAILGKSDHELIHDPLLVFKGMLACRYGSTDEGVHGSDRDGA